MTFNILLTKTITCEKAASVLQQPHFNPVLFSKLGLEISCSIWRGSQNPSNNQCYETLQTCELWVSYVWEDLHIPVSPIWYICFLLPCGKICTSLCLQYDIFVFFSHVASTSGTDLCGFIKSRVQLCIALPKVLQIFFTFRVLLQFWPALCSSNSLVICLHTMDMLLDLWCWNFKEELRTLVHTGSSAFSNLTKD